MCGLSNFFRSFSAKQSKSRRPLVKTTPSFLAEALEKRVMLSTVAWNSATAPYGGDWDTGSNWVGGVVPPAGSDVTINLTGTYTITHNSASGNESVGNITSNEPITLSAGTINVTGNVSLGGNLTLAGGKLNGGTISSTGSAEVLVTSSGGTLNNVTIAAGTTLDATSAIATGNITGGLTLNGTLKLGGATGSNYGFLYFQGNQTLSGSGSVVFGNTTSYLYAQGNSSGTPTATLTIGSGITIHGGNGTVRGYYSGDAIVNNGTINADTSGHLITVGSAGTLSNNGTLEATAGGNLSVSGLTGNVGAASVSGNGSVLSLGGTNYVNNLGLTVPTGTTLNLGGNLTTAGMGAITNTGGTVNLTGTLNNTGATLALTATTGNLNLAGGNINGGNISGSGNATLALTTTSSTLSGGVTINAGAVVDGTQHVNNFFWLTVTGGLTLNGTMKLGAASNYGGFVLFSGSQTLGGSGSVVFAKNYEFSGLLAYYGTLTVGSGITISGAGGFINGYHTGDAIINYGTINATSLPYALLVGAGNTNSFWGGGPLSPVTNYGTLEATGGTLDLGGNFTTGLGTIASSAGGVLDLSGTVNNVGSTLALTTGNLTLYGGTITGGNISTSGGAKLLINYYSSNTLAGVSIDAGSTVDATGGQVQITGGLTLNGTLNMGYNYANYDSSTLYFNNSQTLGGSGTVSFSYGSGYSTNATICVRGGTLTIANPLTITGGFGQIIGCYSIDSIINYGNISESGGTMYVGAVGQAFTNNGNLAAGSGGSMYLEGNFTTGLGNFSSSNGGQMCLSGTLNNTGTTLALTAATGSLLLYGGNINGGNISGIGGSTLVLSSGGGALAGVTINAGTTVDGTQPNAYALVTGGLTLNGNLTLGAARGNNRLYFYGNQTLGGSGTLQFASTSSQDYVYAQGNSGGGPAATLTIASGVTLAGGSTVYGGYGAVEGYYSGDSIANYGNIIANVAGGTLQAGSAGQTFANYGNLTASGGGTLNLAGNFSATGAGNISNSGGTVELTGTLNNTGATLALTATTADLNLVGGNINGGSISGNGSVVLTSSGGNLAGVTIGSGITVDGTQSNTSVNITGGLTLNGTMNLGGANTGNDTAYFLGSQTLNGNGSVVFGSAGAGALRWSRFYAQGDGGANPATLTIGSAITIHGVYGRVQGFYTADNIVNYGNISSDGGGTISVGATGQTFTNYGTLNASNGGTLDFQGTSTAAGLGTYISSTGGTVQLSGTLNDAGNTLTLTSNLSLAGGTINGGDISNGGGELVLTQSGGLLAGVTVDSSATVDGTQNSMVVVTVSGGLALNGGLELGGASYGGTHAYFRGNQSLLGNGSVIFGSTGDNGLYSMGDNGANPATLTIGSNIHVYGTMGNVQGFYLGDTIINNGTIGNAGGTITIGSAGQTFTNNGKLQVSGPGTLILAGNFSAAGTGEIDNAYGTVDFTGTLNNTGTLALNGNLTLDGGTINGGTISAATGANVVLTSTGGTLAGVTISGNAVDGTQLAPNVTITGGLTLNGTLNLNETWLYFAGAGTQTLDGTGSVVFGGWGDSHLVSDGTDGNPTTLAIASTISITVKSANNDIRGYTSYGDSIVNNGNIAIDTGGNLAISGAGTGTLTNNGNITATDATLVIGTYGSWSNSGNISVTAGSTLDLLGNFSTAGIGTITNSASTVNLTGTLDNSSANVEFTSATIGSWNLAGGTIIGGTISSDGTAALMLTRSSGTLDGVTIDSSSATAVDATQGDVTITGDLTLDGTLDLGSTSGAGYGTLSFSGSQTLSGTGSVVFGGSTANGIYVQGDNGGNPATLTIGDSIAIDGGNGTLSTYYSGDAIINNGIINADATSGSIGVGGAGTVTNNGTLEATAGTLSVNGAMINSATATLQATGTGVMYLYGTLANSGTLQVDTGGTVNLAGNYTVAGLGAISNDGTGTMNLNGTLYLDMMAPTGLTVTSGDTYAALNWTDYSYNVDGYSIERSDDGGATFNPIATVPGSTKVYYDTGLTASDTYSYRVAAFNNAIDESAYSNTAVVTVGVPATPGLVGNFYSNTTLSGSPAATLLCGPWNNLDTWWSLSNPPSASLSGENWSGDWTAELTVPVSGNYTIFGSTYSGWGERTIVNGVTTSDWWTLSSPGSQQVTLTAGVPVSFEMQFNATNGGDGVWVSWRGPTVSGTIPASAFTLPAGSESYLPANPSGPTMTVSQGAATLVLNSGTGSLNLVGGAIYGGNISTSGGASLVLTNQTGVLVGVTIDSGSVVDGTQAWANVDINDGLTLNGTLNLGAADGSTYGSVYMVGSQTLDGTGSVVFGGSGNNTLSAMDAGMMSGGAVLTIGSGLTVEGKSGHVTTDSYDSSVVNDGTIDANTSGGAISLFGNRTFTNNGTVEASNGGTLALTGNWSNAGSVTVLDSSSTVDLGGNFTQADLGTFQNTSGGTVNLTGTLNGDLALDDTTGNLSLDGGTINDGTVTATGSAELVLTSGGGTLYQVTIATGTVLDATQSNANATVVNNLWVNGTLDLGDGNGSSAGQLTFRGTEWLDGSGSVEFGGNASNALLVQDDGSPATLYVGVTVEGKTGQIAALNDDGNIDNNGGTIDANTSGGIISIIAGGNGTLNSIGTIEATEGGNLSVAAGAYGNITNSGTITATDGGTVSIPVGMNGNFSNSGTIDADGVTTGGTINITGDNFTSSGTIEALDGGTLHVQNLVGDANSVSVNGTGSDLVLNGNGYVVNDGLTASSGSTLELDGTWSVAAGQTINAWGSTLNLGDQTATSTNEWTNGGTIIADGASVIDLGGMFTVADLGTFQPNGAIVNLVGNLDLLHAPTAPTGLTLTSGENYAVLNWTDSSTVVSGYNIEQSTDGVHFTQIGTVGPNVTSYYDTANGSGLAAGSYTYKVAAFNAVGISSSSAAATVTVGSVTTPGLLAQFYNNSDLGVSEVVGPVLTRVDGNVNFDWPAEVGAGIGVDGASGAQFSAQWSGQLIVPSADTYTFNVGTTGGVACVTVDGTVVYDTWFGNPTTNPITLSAGPVSFQVQYQSATDAENQMHVNWSNAGATVTAGPIPASAFTLPASALGLLPANPAPVVPAAPSNLTVTSGENYAVLNWTDNDASASGYDIQLSTDGGATFTPIGTVGPNATSYYDTVGNGSGLSAGNTYMYQVTAYNALGQSAYCTPASTATVGTVTAPGLLAQFYNNSDLGVSEVVGPVLTRVDSSVNFDWGADAAPGTGVNSANVGPFSVQWSGQLTVPADDTYQFDPVVTGGTAWVTVNGQLVFDNSTDGATVNNQVALSAGTPVTFQVIYEAAASSENQLQLNWYTPDDGSVIPSDVPIPASAFTLPAGAAANLPVNIPGQAVPVGDTLTVDSGSIGIWNLDGGAINGGTLTDAWSTVLVLTGNGGTLNGVTIGDGVVDGTQSNCHATITNGLTVNGRVNLGADDGSTFGQLDFSGTQTLGGSGGDVQFGGNASNGIFAQDNGGPATLSIGGMAAVQGTSGQVVALSGDGSIVNYGSIYANGSGGTLNIGGTGNFTNNGGFVVANGGTLNLNGNWSSAGSFYVADRMSIVNFGGYFTGIGGLNNTSGGTVNLTGNLTGDLYLDGTSTGNVNLDGGSIIGGTVTTTNGAALVLTSNGGTLNGATIDVNSTVDGTQNTCSGTILNGLTLNGQIVLGGGNGSCASAQLIFSGTQALDGDGAVYFAAWGNNGLTVQDGVGASPATLTIGSNISVSGACGQVTALSADDSIVNDGSIYVWYGGGVVYVGGAGNFTNHGALAAYNGGWLRLTGTVDVDGTGVLQSDKSSFIAVLGDLLGDTTNTGAWSVGGNTTFTGSGTALAPQLLEAMSDDLGNTSSGFTANFAYGNLTVAGTTYVQLVSQADNAGTAGSNAVYANALTVAAGATLDLNGLNLYTYALTNDGTIENGTVTIVTAAPTLPAWLDAASIATWDAGTKTLTVSGATTIIGNPGNDPTISNTGATPYVLLVDSSSTVHLGVISGNLALSMTGSGTLVLDYADSYTGSTTISAGTVQLGVANALPTATNLTVDGGILDLDGFSQQVASLSDGGVTTGSTVTNSTTPATFTVDQTASTTFGGQITGNLAFTLAGTGNLKFTGHNTYSGNTTINGGALDVATAANGLPNNAMVVNNAALEFDGAQTLGQLTGTGALTIGNGSTTNTLTLATQTTSGILSDFRDTQHTLTINLGCTLDIANNVLLLNYGSGTTPLAAVANAVAWGSGQGTNANGALVSGTVNLANANSSTAGKYAVGYADHTEISTVPTGNVEVAYTLAGDANLDGSVDILDYQQMAPHYDEAGAYDWSQGDFNHDGHVDILDYQAMAPNYDTKLAAGTLAPAAQPSVAAAAGTFSNAAITPSVLAASSASTAPAANAAATPLYRLYTPVASAWQQWLANQNQADTLVSQLGLTDAGNNGVL